jgi:phosphohistidine phosphatase
MELYILRHGIAEDHNAAGDAQRALTDEGRRKLRRVLERAEKAKVEPSLILSSPYKRARQTAELAAEVLGYDKKIVEIETLVPEGSPAALWEDIRARRQESAIFIAGHEPMLSSSVAWLLGYPTMQVEMKKGALARIDVDRFGPKPHGLLRWLLTPRLAGAD